MTLPSIQQFVANLPSFSPLNLPGSQPPTAQPQLRAFDHLFGTLIHEEQDSPAPVNRKKQDENLAALFASSVPAQPALLLVPSIAIKIKLAIPAAAAVVPGAVEKSQDDKRELEQMPSVVASTPAPMALPNVPDAPPIPTAQPPAKPTPVLEPLTAVDLKPRPVDDTPPSPPPSLASVSTVDHPAEFAAHGQSVPTELSMPAGKFNLAFIAKITPHPAPADQQDTGTPSPIVAPVHAPQNREPNEDAANSTPPPSHPPQVRNEAPPVAAQPPAESSIQVAASNRQPDKPPAKPKQDAVLLEGQLAGRLPEPPTIPAQITVMPHSNLPVEQHQTNSIPTSPSSPPTAPVNAPHDTRPTIAALPEANNVAKAEPVRDLSLRIGNTSANQVEVRIQERGGEVHVAVLSSNASLTTDLRQQVGELIGKLDRAGYHTESSRQSDLPAPQSAQTQPGSGQQDLPGRQQQQQPEAREQLPIRPKRSTQPQWLTEVNGNFGPTAIEGITQK